MSALKGSALLPLIFIEKAIAAETAVAFTLLEADLSRLQNLSVSELLL